MDITERQIVRQIEGTVTVKVHFADTYPGYLDLIKQDGKTWIEPAFCIPKRIPSEMFDELAGQFTGEQEFNTDPEVIRSAMKYNEFFDRYYNNLAVNG